MPPRLRDVRDGVILIEFPGSSDEEANRASVALAKTLSARPMRGLLDAIPAARSLLVLFEPARLRRALGEAIARLAAARGAPGPERRLIRIPVAYGGEAALDLPDLARALGVSEEEFVRRHAAPEYRVAFVGFAPGFPYLVGLPAELRAPRLPSPRPRVRAGAVGIGGPYTGIYPFEMPGGWRLVGRASATLFDPSSYPPALFSAGDRVRFDPVAPEELLAPRAPTHARPAPRGRPVFRVAAAGLFATVQGAPRHGLGSAGVPAGGALDLSSLARANALLGNAAGEPALEIALSGPELESLDFAEVSIAGADLDPRLNGRPAPFAKVFRIAGGDRLRFGRARRGARAYLAVRGGFVDPRPTGEPARRVEAGEKLLAADAPPAFPAADHGGGIDPGEEIWIRVILGPQAEHFSAATVDRFVSTCWRVSSMSDRRGLRLEGERLGHVLQPEIPPEGTVPGSIQVPGEGLPIVLGPDGPVTGGYPKIATVIGADLPLLGQAAPGSGLRFRAIGLEEAVESRQEYH